MTPTSGSARLAWAGLISMVFSLSVGVAGPARANGYGVSTPDPTLAYPVDIGGRQTLGVVSVFGNDWYGIPFGDRYDRWRTGDMCAVSVLRGKRWRDQLPSQPFELMEYRFRGEVIAPDNLTAPAPGDRLYAPSWWLGATTHFGWSGYDVAAGRRPGDGGAADRDRGHPQRDPRGFRQRSDQPARRPTRCRTASTWTPMPRSGAGSR
jgi:hypothetical protein